MKIERIEKTIDGCTWHVFDDSGIGATGRTRKGAIEKYEWKKEAFKDIPAGSLVRVSYI